MVKLKSQGSFVRSKSRVYTGELGGIKANTKKGVSLKNTAQ